MPEKNKIWSCFINILLKYQKDNNIKLEYTIKSKINSQTCLETENIKNPNNNENFKIKELKYDKNNIKSLIISILEKNISFHLEKLK